MGYSLLMKLFYCGSLMLIAPGIFAVSFASPFLMSARAPITTGIISVFNGHILVVSISRSLYFVSFQWSLMRCFCLMVPPCLWVCRFCYCYYSYSVTNLAFTNHRFLEQDFGRGCPWYLVEDSTRIFDFMISSFIDIHSQAKFTNRISGIVFLECSMASECNPAFIHIRRKYFANTCSR